MRPTWPALGAASKLARGVLNDVGMLIVGIQTFNSCDRVGKERLCSRAQEESLLSSGSQRMGAGRSARVSPSVTQ